MMHLVMDEMFLLNEAAEQSLDGKARRNAFERVYTAAFNPERRMWVYETPEQLKGVVISSGLSEPIWVPNKTEITGDEKNE